MRAFLNFFCFLFYKKNVHFGCHRQTGITEQTFGWGSNRRLPMETGLEFCNIFDSMKADYLIIKEEEKCFISDMYNILSLNLLRDLI